MSHISSFFYILLFFRYRILVLIILMNLIKRLLRPTVNHTSLYGHSLKSGIKLKAKFGFFFSSLITYHFSLNFRHSSLKIPITLHEVCLAPSLNLSSLNIFQLFVGPIPTTWCSFYFFFFFLQPLVPKLTKPSEEKKKKKPTT